MQHVVAVPARSDVRPERVIGPAGIVERIESGGWVPNPDAIVIADVAGDVIAAARDAAIQKRLALGTEISPDAAVVFADATALRQVLGNLVDNAVRHTTSGEVVLFSRRQERGVLIGVRDTGVGIAAEHLPRIFERFYRVDPGRSRAQGGTGLGLAIVKHLVEAHGGRVRAASALGHGSEIAAHFPDRPSRT